MKLRKVDRRRFLRDAIGPVLPLPFLHCMASKASSATHTEVPLRFVTLFKPNGVHPPSWNINGGSEFDFRMSPMMGHLRSIKMTSSSLTIWGILDFRRMRIRLGDFSQDIIEIRIQHPSIRSSLKKYGGRVLFGHSSSPPRDCFPTRSVAVTSRTISKANPFHVRVTLSWFSTDCFGIQCRM